MMEQQKAFIHSLGYSIFKARQGAMMETFQKSMGNPNSLKFFFSYFSPTNVLKIWKRPLLLHFILFYLVLKIINKNEEIKEVDSQWKVILIMNYDVVKCTTLIMMGPSWGERNENFFLNNKLPTELFKIGKTRNAIKYLCFSFYYT